MTNIKNNTSGKMITLKKIKQKIIDWRDGKISTIEIQQWGEDKYMSEEMKNSQLNEVDHFIAIEVLQYLEFINMNLTIKEDIPYILIFIDSGHLYKDACKNWYKYRDNINYKKRAEELKDDLFYREYCMSILKSHTKNPSENEKNNHEKTDPKE